MKALTEGEYTIRELAEMADLHYTTTLAYCRTLHEAGIIFIAKWEKDALGRDSVLIYKLNVNPGVDVPRKGLTRAEQQRKYRERKKMRTLVDVNERMARAGYRVFAVDVAHVGDGITVSVNPNHTPITPTTHE